MSQEPKPPSEDVAASKGKWASSPKRVASDKWATEPEPESEGAQHPRTEERLSFLLRESNHRIRNTLASISALVRHAASSATSIEDFVPALQLRLDALVELHEALGRDEPHDLNVSEMAGMALGAQVPSGRYDVLGESPTVPALAVNALKHGALSTPAGRVVVEIQVDESEDTLEIAWRERGGPPADPPEHRGFGMSVIERGLEYETGGRSRLVFSREGLEARLTLPLPRPSVADRARRDPGD
jgi:two-component sensor histidine kinase